MQSKMNSHPSSLNSAVTGQIGIFLLDKPPTEVGGDSIFQFYRIFQNKDEKDKLTLSFSFCKSELIWFLYMKKKWPTRKKEMVYIPPKMKFQVSLCNNSWACTPLSFKTQVQNFQPSL